MRCLVGLPFMFHLCCRDAVTVFKHDDEHGHENGKITTVA